MDGEIWRRFGECTGDAFERYVEAWVFVPYMFGFSRELWKLNVAWECLTVLKKSGFLMQGYTNPKTVQILGLELVLGRSILPKASISKLLRCAIHACCNHFEKQNFISDGSEWTANK